jgi:hypothetical protein
MHPDAALEHEEQVTYFEERRDGLGARYHSATMLAITSACQTPLRFRVVRPPDIRKVSLRGFPYFCRLSRGGCGRAGIGRGAPSTRTGLLGAADLTRLDPKSMTN